MKYVYIKDPCSIAVNLEHSECHFIEIIDIQYQKFEVGKESENAYYIKHTEYDSDLHCVYKNYAIEAESLEKLDLLIYLS